MLGSLACLTLLLWALLFIFGSSAASWGTWLLALSSALALVSPWEEARRTARDGSLTETIHGALYSPWFGPQAGSCLKRRASSIGLALWIMAGLQILDWDVRWINHWPQSGFTGLGLGFLAAGSADLFVRAKRRRGSAD